jgi:dienelactone hydrolase
MFRFPVVSRRVAFLRALVAIVLLSFPGPAASDMTSCTQAIDAASLRYIAKSHKALAVCAVAEASGKTCDVDRRDRALEKQEAGLTDRLLGACTDADLSAAGFPGNCEDPDAAPFTASDLARCLVDRAAVALDAAIAIELPPAESTAPRGATRCRRAVTRSSAAYLVDDLAARAACLDATSSSDCRLEGAATGDTETDAALAVAKTGLTHDVQSRCDGIDLAALGFPGDCSDVGEAGFDSADLAACLAVTHDAIARDFAEASRPSEAPSTTTTTTSSTTTTSVPGYSSLADVVAPYGDADGDGHSNNVELAACSNPADAASTPLNDAGAFCTSLTIFSDTLGDSWGSTDRLTDPTYFAAVNALVADNLADCSAYCAATPNIGSPQACLGAWPWSGVPEYGKYAAGHTIEVNFPDEDGNGLAGRMFLPPGVTCTPAAAPICDGVTDSAVCSDTDGRKYPAVVLCDGFIGVQRMYYWAAQRLAEQGYVTLAFDVSGQGLSQGTFPNGDAGIAADIPGGGGGFARDIGTAMNWMVSDANPVRGLLAEKPAVIVNQATGAQDRIERYVLGLAGHSMGATAAVAYQQSTDPAYPVRARAVIGWSHFDAENTIGNVPIQLHSGDEDNGFIQPPGSGNRGPEMERRYDRLGGDRDLDGNADFAPRDRQIVMTEAGTHLDYSKVPWAYTPVWSEELEYHYTLAWFDRYLRGDLRRRMSGVEAGRIVSVDRYADYAECSSGPDCFRASERLRMVHERLSDVWCSRYDLAEGESGDMKGAGCATE